MAPEVAAQLPGWQYGLLGVAAFVFAGVIVYLFKFYNKRERRWDEERKGMEAERKAWAKKETEWELEREDRAKKDELERLRIRAEYEEKHRALVAQYAEALKEERDLNRVHEDGVRREFAETMEAVSAKAQESTQKLVEMLQKFYDRFVGPRSRSRDY